jgi:hypothetical protein
MLMELRILPLAITTMVGPQILVAIIFITAKKDAVKISLSYLAGILLAASSFITVVFVAARLFGLSADSAGNPPSWANTVEVALIALLIIMSLRSYLTRKTAKPPKWLTGLQETKPSTAFKLALLLIYLMPTDIAVMLTVGLHLATHGSNPADLLYALPFLAVVMLIAGFPLYSYLLFRKRAKEAMPKIRDWMQDNSWLVNIIIYVFFIYLVIT